MEVVQSNKFLDRMGKILFFILHCEETFSLWFFETYYTLLYETLKSTLDTPLFRGEFHPLNGVMGTYKKIVSLQF